MIFCILIFSKLKDFTSKCLFYRLSIFSSTWPRKINNMFQPNEREWKKNKIYLIISRVKVNAHVVVVISRHAVGLSSLSIYRCTCLQPSWIWCREETLRYCQRKCSQWKGRVRLVVFLYVFIEQEVLWRKIRVHFVSFDWVHHVNFNDHLSLGRIHWLLPAQMT